MPVSLTKIYGKAPNPVNLFKLQLSEIFRYQTEVDHLLKQDDEIITTCKYNTQDRSKYTLGGLGTYDEMCLNLIWYYPRNEKLATCYQEVDFNEWLKFFSKLNHNNDFTWVVNNRWTFWEDTIASLQASEKLTNDPEYTERLFQEFYDSAAKAEIKAVSFICFNILK